ncbi:hypothetical protein ROHU_030066 [Labeo rohita]|uniref:Uncharacterized protein n=1 Tax=Labeo rohita TaxID=84645 RepID=A0A498LT98_LABRO|nr:hypothetical protein ROHU_030066 [Labeo rohita]
MHRCHARPTAWKGTQRRRRVGKRVWHGGKGGTRGRGQSCDEEFKGEKIHGSGEQEGRAGGLRPGESPPTLGRAADRQATRTEGGITGIVTPPQPP